jgi:hypothetical protein
LVQDEALQRRDIRHRHAYQVIAVAGHEVALHHLVVFADATLEFGERGLGLLLQADGDEHRQAQTQRLRIRQGDIARNHTGGLQRLDPRQTGRGRQVHAPRQFHVAQAAVFLELGEDFEIECVELHIVLSRS